MRKNFGRRIAACFFAGLLLLGSVLPALAFENERQFPDVQGSEWYALPVNYLARRQVLGGKEDGKFHPEDPVTRAEFLKLLALVSGKKINSQRLQGKFSDVDNNAWYAEYVYWSVKEKIANGVGDNRFAPNSPISRQEIAVLLWRYNKNAMGRVLPKNRTMNFRDASSCAGWAAKEVAKVSGAGLLSGYEDRTFRPWGKATRAEAAQIIYNYLGSYQKFEQGCNIDDLRYIMHGGGQTGQFLVSNSMQAMEESYGWGNRMIEVDFSWTADQQLACVHGWGGEYPPYSTLSQFMQTKIFGSLTPMSLDTLAAWMRSHPEVRVIPDFKERNTEGLRMISVRYPDLIERFLPYIYSIREYDSVKNLGFRNIFLILYRMPAAEKRDPSQVMAFAKEKDLAGVAIAPFQEREYFAAAQKAGIPLLCYVVDKLDWMVDMARQGADGYFTDRQNVRIQW